MADPFYSFVFPDSKQRTRLLPWRSRKLLAYAGRFGLIFTDEGHHGSSFWLGPEHTNLQLGGILQTGLFLFPFKVSFQEFKRSMQLTRISDRLHKHSISGQHLYLMEVGVEPAQQSHGLGRALVQAGLSRADALGVPCYLETYNPKNLGFYNSLGFRVVGTQRALASAPQVWGLLRASSAT
jgi:ribosomal protein S18 acetylase RimI-like enzyme